MDCIYGCVVPSRLLTSSVYLLANLVAVGSERQKYVIKDYHLLLRTASFT